MVIPPVSCSCPKYLLTEEIGEASKASENECEEIEDYHKYIVSSFLVCLLTSFKFEMHPHPLRILTHPQCNHQCQCQFILAGLITSIWPKPTHTLKSGSLGYDERLSFFMASVAEAHSSPGNQPFIIPSSIH